MSVLQIFRGDEFLEEVVLARAVMGLGRHPQNDIVLDDRSLSRFHARVERRGDQFVVVDCGAQNGVHLNGTRVVGESSLTPGDRITLGRYVAVFDSAQRGATPPKYDLTKPIKGQKAAAAPKLSALDAEIQALEVDVNLDVNLEEDADATRKARYRNGEEPKDDPAESAERTLQKAEPTLVLLFNGMEVSRHPVSSAGLTVGRSKQCDVVISLLGLSRRHAKVTRGKDGITVEDLGSQNGTWVNNQRISGQRKLKHGDLLNFYDYAVLFLEDGDVEVGFPGPMFSPPDASAPDDLSDRETNRSGAAPVASKHRPPTAKSPVPLVDSAHSEAAHGGKSAVRPAHNGHNGNGLQSASELVDLGEGSFLGDEFEEASGKEALPGSSLLDEDALEIEPRIADKTNATDVVDDFDLRSELKNVPLDEAGGFEGMAGTEGDQAKFDDKTSATVHARGNAWATDAELMKALSNAPDVVMVTIEVTLSNKPYTQMALNQTVTRVGTDARCELSLPKSSGLMPWHMTLLHLGGAVVLYRAARAGRIQLAESDADMAILRDGDLVDCGKVRLKIRVK